jgi:thymidylate kinase
MIESSLRPPDLVIVLDAPGEVMFERKQEHDVATLEQRRHWYADIATNLPNAVVIDATQPPDQVLRQAVDAVWRTICKR